MSRTVIVAHRGDSAHHPDNTWTAIRAAQGAGADACEVVVQRLADGTPAICHDYQVGGRRLMELDAEAFCSLCPDAPLLDPLLEWSRAQRFPLLLEVKDASLLDTLAARLRNLDPSLVTVASFHGPFLRDFASACPGVPTFLMLGTVLEPDDMVELAHRYRTGGIHPCWEARDPKPHRLLSQAAAARVRNAGLRLILWHEERPEELNALLRLAPDAICTNDPGLLKRLRDTTIPMRR